MQDTYENGRGPDKQTPARAPSSEDTIQVYHKPELRLFSLSHTVDRWDWHDQIAIHFFHASRKVPVAPYDQLADLDGWPLCHRHKLEADIDGLFTEAEATLVANHLRLKHGWEVTWSEVHLPWDFGEDEPIPTAYDTSDYPDEGIYGWCEIDSDNSDFPFDVRAWCFLDDSLPSVDLSVQAEAHGIEYTRTILRHCRQEMSDPELGEIVRNVFDFADLYVEKHRQTRAQRMRVRAGANQLRQGREEE